MVDVSGLELTADDVERLQHPQVGGVILFARNFAAPLQLIQLAHSIREIRKPGVGRIAKAQEAIKDLEKQAEARAQSERARSLRALVEEHGLPESHCKQCNPGLTFTAQSTVPADWCKEHAVPESKCTKCHPELVARFIDRAFFVVVPARAGTQSP